MPTYNANIIKDADTTTPTSGTWTVPEADDAIREVKRVMAYEAGVTAVSSYPYTILTTDSTLYCTGAGGTVAGPQLSTVSTTTIEKRIVVINDSSSAVIFDPYSTETVGGASTYSIAAGTIAEFLGHAGTDWEIIRGQATSLYDGTAYRSASATPAANTVPVSNASGNIDFPSVKSTDGTNLIRVKIINIGDWNMDATDAVSVAHGLTLSKIIAVSVQVRNDADSQHRMFNPDIDSSANGWIDDCTATNVVLYRKSAGVFDNVNHDSTSYNRGWITITYVE